MRFNFNIERSRSIYFLLCFYVGLPHVGCGSYTPPPRQPSLTEQFERTTIVKQPQPSKPRDNRLVFELQQRGIDVRESDRGVVINLPDVLFESGTATLTKRAHEIIFEIAQVLLRSPSLNLLIEGHTDSVGDIGHNYQLSDSRARAVAAELETNGIARQTITTQAFGETSPIATNRTEQGRRLNRRVEVVIQG